MDDGESRQQRPAPLQASEGGPQQPVFSMQLPIVGEQPVQPPAFIHGMHASSFIPPLQPLSTPSLPAASQASVAGPQQPLLNVPTGQQQQFGQPNLQSMQQPGYQQRQQLYGMGAPYTQCATPFPQPGMAAPGKI